MLRFGVEIECVCPMDIDFILPPGWGIVGDCSIKPYGREFVSPIFEWEQRGQVFDIVEKMQKTGMVKSNQSCGFHVHMSGMFPEWNRISEIGKEWYEKIKPGFRPAKERRNKYCREVFDADPQDKYQLIRLVRSFIRQDTTHIEVRLFNAHLSKRWIARCLGATKQLGELLESEQQVLVTA